MRSEVTSTANGTRARPKICVIVPTLTSDIQKTILLLSERFEFHLIYVAYPTLEQLASGLRDFCSLYPVPPPLGLHSLAESHLRDLPAVVPVYRKMLGLVRRVHEMHGVDLNHAHWAIPCGFLSSISGSDVPLIVTVRGSDIRVFGKNPLISPFVRVALKRATRIVALSNDLAERVIALGVASDSVSVIPCGVDLDDFHPSHPPHMDNLVCHDRIPRVLYVGNLIALKQVDRLIKAAAAVRQHYAFEMTVIGAGPERASLEQLAQHLNLTEVSFLGSVPHSEIPRYMAGSDLLVLPSRSEGLPNCVQEAMASGLPVLAPRLGGLPDIIQDGVNGFLFDTPADMMEKLSRLLASGDLRRTVGQRALRTAELRLSIDRTIRLTEDLYQSLLGGGECESQS